MRPPATGKPTQARLTDAEVELSALPRLGLDRCAAKSLLRAVLERRTTYRFCADPLPESLLQAVLTLAARAPSPCNLQPWRFIVVRRGSDRACLCHATQAPPGISEAPVLVLAAGVRREVDAYAGRVLSEAAERQKLLPAPRRAWAQRAAATLVCDERWARGQTMLAVAFLLLAAEAYQIDSALLDVVDAGELYEHFGLPADAQVASVIALGRAAEPPPPSPGRLAIERIVFDGHYGQAWKPVVARDDGGGGGETEPLYEE